MSSIPRYANRPKLGTQLHSPTSQRPSAMKSPTSPKLANGNVSHQTTADIHYNAAMEVGPVLESPKGVRAPIGLKSPSGSRSPIGSRSPLGSPRGSLGERSPGSSPRGSLGEKSTKTSSSKSLPPKSPSHRSRVDGHVSDSELKSDSRSDDLSDRSDRGFDSFVMTGDKILRTTPKKAGSLERGTNPQQMLISDSDSAPPSSSSTPEKYDVNSNQQGYPGEEPAKPSRMVTSKSAEKVQNAPMNKNLRACFASKSQENSFSGENYLIDIDIDDKTTSFDALMLEQSNTSIDKLIEKSKRDFSDFRLDAIKLREEESSTDTKSSICPNCRSQILDAVCACVDDSRPPPLPAERNVSSSDHKDRPFPHVRSERLTASERAEGDDDASDTGSIYHQPLKDIDRPSAIRLAKRLYQLEGFKKSDVSRHLSKKNEFSQLVGEEYLKYFDFTGETLDKALRAFLSKFSLHGETQERERILCHFSHRYIECNPNTYNSDDACHTLTCAIMLLNTDLHGQNIGRKMTCSEFIENLSDLNDGEDFPRDILRQLYSAIKSDPLVWALDEEESQNGHCPGSAFLTDNGQLTAQNPFLMVPDPTKTTEYISGYVMRKCCVDQDGRKTPMGKRSWKMFYATLKDMILYLHKDQQSFHKSSVYHMNNAIRIHHSLAVRANDYTKKHHVFRLRTADWAEYLFQTSDSKELQRWVDTINYVAASLSAPPLPGAVGSQRKFQRPLMPSSYTRLNLPQQLLHQQTRLEELNRDLKEHRSYPPEKGARPRLIQDYLEKESYLEYELQRFNMYVYLLQTRITTYPSSEALEPSLVETVIGEVDEPTNASPGRAGRHDNHNHGNRRSHGNPLDDIVERRPEKHGRHHVQRSQSDRQSYRDSYKIAIMRLEADAGEELL